jgi:hypothetical protein
MKNEELLPEPARELPRRGLAIGALVFFAFILIVTHFDLLFR